MSLYSNSFQNLGSCGPAQVATLSIPVNDISFIGVIGTDCEYNRDDLLYSYSTDNINWTCYDNYENTKNSTANLNTDFYLKIKVKGPISNIIEVSSDGTPTDLSYTTQIAEGFKFNPTEIASQLSSNIYNPYSNMEGALQLQTQLTDTVLQLFGIGCYYFKLTPDTRSKDITFKEYTLMNVESVKQIKIMVRDGQMPSSKPEFNDFGLDWATDWEVEIGKTTFATAFGISAQPMEGDLVYIPMMKRMWMVSSAYDEKNGSLMWNSTTFKVALVKYQEKDSVDLGDVQDMVDGFVKNKYEDLFGDQEDLASGEATVSSPRTSSEELYPIYRSDATRKWMTVNNIEIVQHSLYYRATLISENHYKFNNPSIPGKIVYQRPYCGSEGSCSFIILTTNISSYKGILLEIGDIKLVIEQNTKTATIYPLQKKELKVTIPLRQYFFIWLRWSDTKDIIEMGAAQYAYPKNIPLYQLQNHHYYFDLDNPTSIGTTKYDIEFVCQEKKDITLNQFYGLISNIKIFDKYVTEMSDLFQQYPNNQHLIVNDTVRRVIDLKGPGLK